MLGKLFLALLKLVPMGIFLRSAFCKLDVPVMGCDSPLCPVAIGEAADCTPTANTAEQKAWCEAAWVPWTLGIFERAGVEPPIAFECKAPTYTYLKVIGVCELVGYVLLWLTPRLGALLCAAIMAGALHLHLTFLQDAPEKLGLQFTLLATSLLVFLLSGGGGKDKEKAA